MNHNVINTRDIVRQSLIAALYVALTWAIKDFSYGPLQIRISEIMTLLAFYNKKHAKGLLIGCFLANIFSPLGIVDMIIGTFASFLAFFAMNKSKNIIVASMMPAVCSIFVAFELYFFSDLSYMLIPIVYSQIFASEFIIVTVIGVPFFKSIENHKFFKEYIIEKELENQSMSENQ